MNKPMHRLWLDYHRQAPGYHWPGLLVLLVGILFCSWEIDQSISTATELATTEQHVNTLKRASDRRRLLSRTDNTAGMNMQQEMRPISPSAARWDALFGTLERAGDDSITLLGLEPGPKEITITGEAKDIDAALDYVERLQTSTVFSDARLAKHEVIREHPQHPVRFSLVALWREGAR